MNRHPFSYIEAISFLVFVSLGYWIGKGVTNFRPSATGARVALDTPSPIPSLPDGERILLLVGVDNLDSDHPRLVSLWLLTYYLNNQPVQLLPIYPTSNTPASQFETELLNSFSISKTGGTAQLSPSLLKLLADNNFWLSGYIILDTQATMNFLDLLGGLPSSNKLSGREETIQAIPGSSNSPQNALQQQTTLFSQACIALAQAPRQPDWSSMLDLVPEHIITDLQPNCLLTEISILSANLHQIRCEFPVQPNSP